VGESDSLNPRGCCSSSSRPARTRRRSLRRRELRGLRAQSPRDRRGPPADQQPGPDEQPDVRGRLHAAAPAFHFDGTAVQFVDSFIFTNVVFDRGTDLPVTCRRPSTPGSCWAIVRPCPSSGASSRHTFTTPTWRPSSDRLPVRRGLLGREPLQPVALGAPDARCRHDLGAYPTVMRNPRLGFEDAPRRSSRAGPPPPRHATVRQGLLRRLCLRSIPEGWVDPYPEFFAKLARYAEGASSRFELWGSSILMSAGIADAYFQHLKSTSETLGGMTGSRPARLVAAPTRGGEWLARGDRAPRCTSTWDTPARESRLPARCSGCSRDSSPRSPASPGSRCSARGAPRNS